MFAQLTLSVSVATLLLISSVSALGTSNPFGGAAVATAVASGANYALSSPQSSVALAAATSAPVQRQVRPQLGAEESARAHKLNAILQKLMALEAHPSDSLDECLRWANLAEKYERLRVSLSGSQQTNSAHLSLRPNEERKRIECEQIQTTASELGNRLDSFRELAISENNAIEFTRQILNDYLDLIYSNEQALRNAFENLRASDERVRSVCNQLDQFIGSMSSRLPQSHEFVGGVDGLASLDESIRRLVDREDALNEEEFERLVGLSGDFERELLSVAPSSGRFRYLSGTLDAANAVILRQAMREDNLEAAGESHLAQSAPMFAVAPVASSGLGSNDFDDEEDSFGGALNPVDGIAELTPQVSSQAAGASVLAAPMQIPQMPSMPPTLRRLTEASRTKQPAPLSAAIANAFEQQASSAAGEASAAAAASSSGAQPIAAGVRNDLQAQQPRTQLPVPASIVPFGAGRDSSFAQQISAEQQRLGRPALDAHLLQPQAQTQPQQQVTSATASSAAQSTSPQAPATATAAATATASSGAFANAPNRRSRVRRV